jgi:hypothetical protein
MMTLTDSLLVLVIFATLARMAQAHIHQRQLIRWLDAIAEMTGDQLKTIINLKGKP